MKKVMVSIVALAGLCLAMAEGANEKYVAASNAQTTYTQTTSVNTNLYLLDKGFDGPRVITVTSATGGLLFFDNTTAVNVLNTIGSAVTNVVLNYGMSNASTNSTALANYQTSKKGGIPIAGAAEVVAGAGQANVIRLDGVNFPKITCPILFLSTNSTATNYTLTVNVLRLSDQ